LRSRQEEQARSETGEYNFCRKKCFSKWLWVAIMLYFLPWSSFLNVWFFAVAQAALRDWNAPKALLTPNFEKFRRDSSFFCIASSAPE